jgi:hypothetical protein
LAGTHGEGYKIGALVMTVAGYNVRYEADSWIRNFNLPDKTPDELYCRLNPIALNKLDRLKADFRANINKGCSRQLKANPWEDVCLKIGKYGKKGKLVPKGLSFSRFLNISTSSSYILHFPSLSEPMLTVISPVEDFLEWIKVSLDLHRPSKMLRTRDGNLILDEKFSGKIYLKGLLMDDASSAKPFKYGYNFFHGEVNRDRERLRNSKEEARMLGRIWVEAIQLDETATLPQLVDMLQSSILYADVDRIEENIPMVTAKKIWQHLLGQDATGKRFYYNVEDGGKVFYVLSLSRSRDANCWSGRRTDHQKLERGTFSVEESDVVISKTSPAIAYGRRRKISSSAECAS